MTSNQINYHKMKEEKRHNRAVERETKRANLVQAANTRYHTEMLGRYNDAYIDHLSNSLQESKRHNLASESKDLLYLTRTADETERHNRASEDLSARQMSSNYVIASMNRDVSLKQIEENRRHNTVTEALTSQNNVYNYTLGQERNAIDSAKRVDQARVDTQRQLLQMQQLEETKQHNRYMEGISDRQTSISALTNASSQINLWYKSLTD